MITRTFTRFQSNFQFSKLKIEISAAKNVIWPHLKENFTAR